ncbi:MAG: mechanosensitive ion channel protein MscS, partial [Gallionellaceae bacterium]
MDFFNSMFGYFWGEESFPVLIMILCIAVLLFHFRREERASLINTLGFFFACQAGLLVSGVLYALEFSRAAAVLHEAFIIGAGIAVIRLWGQMVFRV